jgi:hypothetical protein
VACDSGASREPVVGLVGHHSLVAVHDDALARVSAGDGHFHRFSFLIFYGILREIRDDRYYPLQIYLCKLFLTFSNIAKMVGAIQCH